MTRRAAGDGAQARFPALAPEAMSPAQRQAAEAIAAGPRGGLRGPFNAWLRSPELADRAQRLGEYLRFRSSVPKRLNELAILITARAWDAEFVNPVFWNPHNRGPDCLNPAAARSVLPHMLERTRWALEGLSIAEMRKRTEAEVAAKTYVLPEPGAMAYMLSKQQYLSDDVHAWHPHLMFFLAASDADMGANLPGSPMIHPYPPAPDPVTTYLVAVRTWSDGTDAMMK